jgi:hypothetical protein
MQLSHSPAATAAVFDDPNLISSAGLVPILRLAETAGLGALADERLSVPTDKGANAGAKVSALVAGMVAGADSIEDMALLRHGGMGRVFDRCYAPETLGSFLRAFTFGHVRQLDGVASRFLTGLAAATPVISGVAEVAVIDIDDTIIEVHGYAKQGAGFGYTKVRGLNALVATVSTDTVAPVIVAQRLRKGSANSARGAARLVRDALKTTRTLARGDNSTGVGRVLLRADSAYYGHAVIGAAVKTGAEVSVTVRLDPRIKAAISAITDDSWTTIEYPRAVFDEDTGVWISKAQVAEVPYVAFTSKKKTEQVPGRLVVRRIPDLPTPRRRNAPGRTDSSSCSGTTPSSPPPPGRSGHRHRRQGPPRARHHRAGPRRPEELRPGAPAVGEVHRQRRLAGPGRHGVQPHPRRRHPHRPTSPRESDDRDRAAHPGRCPGPGRELRPANRPAPTRAWPWEHAWRASSSASTRHRRQ